MYGSTGAAPSIGDSSMGLARAVLMHGPISRSDLGRRLGLSPASLTRLSKPLFDSGLLVEVSDTLISGVGRPTKPLDVRLEGRRYVGVKLTGDSAFGVLTDLRVNELSSAHRRLDGTDVAGVVRQLRSLVLELANGAPITALGVTVGGQVIGSRVVARAPFLAWRDVDLASALEAGLGVPVLVENDVVGLAAAEQWFGAGRGTASFAVLTIGVGVGYGLVVDDRVISTRDSGLGLGGHVPLDANGPLCGSGHRGCSDAMLTQGSIRAQVSDTLGRAVEYDEALALAAAGVPAALSVVQASGRALGRLVALIANIAMVDTVVLSGEGIGLWKVVADEIVAAAHGDRDAEATPLQITVDDSGTSSWARGAAAVAIQHTLTRFAVAD
ncbi:MULTISPECIES: ROK family transcriptional regulator [unclassified Cryobacterium]|uniref:ROK family transcriptional regulator n=1 Tax=unclassified Cryobacterium TaxID=2649013 RepID=UPI00106C39F7|nr:MULTISPECIES: ROK family transcriptional regulator [unclassified Cryobacterium]TFC54958.1 ROK family transcriptional regulator [Cryobacterium sp. TMB3-1-2]TFC70362.1 ROK family transcriptional regulator [Cryobacterium sp. TMB3-15]TFC75703.1 ROK family transcriptional regulator [Cryobacterium sp. TMB3-10]TFD45473.1 ROK family transcriptional regulator [Cryobacterium sp. TMB3-12]